MDKSKAIELLTNTLQQGGSFEKWQYQVAAALESVFGKDSRQVRDFQNTRLDTKQESDPLAWAKTAAVDRLALMTSHGKTTALLESAIGEVRDTWPDEVCLKLSQISAVQRIARICDRFHPIAQRLRTRRAGRPPLLMEDEYDVQYLLNALLSVDFDDLQPEDPVPVLAGASSRIDFVLRTEKIGIETKMMRNGLGRKEVGDQLIADAARFQKHPDCKTLVCLVYDPNSSIQNPRGFENDLADLGENSGMPVVCFIRP